MKNPFILIILTSSIFLSGCTKYYRGMAPKNADLLDKHFFEDVKIRYNNHYLSDVGGEGLSKKARQENIIIYALEISNESLEPVILGKTHLISIGKKPAAILESPALHKNLKHNLTKILPVLALSPMFGAMVSGGDEAELQEQGPWPYVVGPLFVTGEMVHIANQNFRLKRDLTKHNLYGVPIKPGETAHGIVGISVRGTPYNKKLGLFRISHF